MLESTPSLRISTVTYQNSRFKGTEKGNNLAYFDIMKKGAASFCNYCFCLFIDIARELIRQVEKSSRFLAFQETIRN